MGHLIVPRGAHFVRNDGIDRHHRAHHGHQHDRPHGRAKRHRRQFFGADVPGHGDIDHAHPDRGQLADQHGPRQAPQGENFGTDRCGGGGHDAGSA
jgi:hypothetical protein